MNTANKHLKELYLYKKNIRKYPLSDANIAISKAQFYFYNYNFHNWYDIPKYKTSNDIMEYIENVLIWIGKNLNHDGYTLYRGKLNAESILSYCIEKKLGVNCLMHAIVFQEIMINQGIKAWLIQGNPYDYKIGDCHWLVNVECDKGKDGFITIDPVWLGYFKDSERKPLNCFEIREKIANNEKFFPSQGYIVDYYEYLMARYLFFFGFFTINSVGVFENVDQQKIYLGPKGFDIKSYIESKEKNRFLPFNIQEYLYFSRFEEKAIILEERFE